MTKVPIQPPLTMCSIMLVTVTLSCTLRKNTRFLWRRKERKGRYFKPLLFYLSFILQRILESLNDRVFHVGNTSKCDLFQPCHLALAVTRDLSIYIQCKEKIAFGIRNLGWVANSANFVTIGLSLNLSRGPQL